MKKMRIETEFGVFDVEADGEPRRSVYSGGSLPKDTFYNNEQELVGIVNGKEKVLISKEDFKRFEGKSVREILALKKKQAERAG